MHPTLEDKNIKTVAFSMDIYLEKATVFVIRMFINDYSTYLAYGLTITFHRATIQIV